jgi:hypothetical protein
MPTEYARAGALAGVANGMAGLDPDRAARLAADAECRPPEKAGEVSVWRMGR